MSARSIGRAKRGTKVGPRRRRRLSAFSGYHRWWRIWLSPPAGRDAWIGYDFAPGTDVSVRHVVRVDYADARP